MKYFRCILSSIIAIFCACQLSQEPQQLSRTIHPLLT